MDRLEQKVARRLVAIFAADVAGYSRLMAQDEIERTAGSYSSSRDHGSANRGTRWADCQHGWR